MLIPLVGLLQDGSTPSPAVNQNPRTTITVQKGCDFTVQVTVQTPAGISVPLTGGAMVLTVKAPSDLVLLVQKTATIASPTATFTFTPADTKGLVPGRYLFDVWFTHSTLRDAVIPLSGLVLEAAVTPAP